MIFVVPDKPPAIIKRLYRPDCFSMDIDHRYDSIHDQNFHVATVATTSENTPMQIR
jgi:hypothetical protein